MEDFEKWRLENNLTDRLKTLEDIDFALQFLQTMRQEIVEKGIQCYHCKQYIPHDQIVISPYIDRFKVRKTCCFICQQEEYGRVCIFCKRKRYPYHEYCYSGSSAVICDSCIDQRSLDHQRLMEERTKVGLHIDRAVKLSLPATLTFPEWLFTLEDFRWMCAYCGDSYEHLDHFIAMEQGGGTTRGNCIPACSNCNMRKQRKLPEEITFVSTEVIANIRSYLIQFP